MRRGRSAAARPRQSDFAMAARASVISGRMGAAASASAAILA
jgi:hypothetical protein